MIDSTPQVATVSVIEMLWRALSAGCLGIAVGWLVVCRASLATPFGDLTVSAAQLGLVALLAVLSIVAALWAGRGGGGIAGGPWSAATSIGLMGLSAWVGLAIAVGGLHRVPAGLVPVAHGVVVVGGLVAALAVIVRLEGVPRRRAAKAGAFIVGALLMVFGPVVFEQS